MSSRNIVLLLIAIVIAAGMAYGVRSRINSANQAPVEVSNATKVLVAKSDIKPGSFIRADADLAWVDWPATTLQPSYIVQGARTSDEFNGAVVRRAINAGEPVTDNVLVKTSEGGFMSAVLNPGMRAVTISVNATSGNAGFVFPGDKVDLIVTHNLDVPGEDESRERIVASETFVQDVRVLAVDQMLDNPENKAVIAKTVTLEVLPKQAEMINVAADLGKISLSLRSLARKEMPEDTAAGLAEEPLDAGLNEGGPLVDPFFPEEGASDYTSSGDISRVLGNNHNGSVNVIRGNERERQQFYQGAK